MELDVLKYFIMESGEQFVMLAGIYTMRKSFVVNLVINLLLEHYTEFMYLMVVEKYGLMTLIAMAMSSILQVVHITDGERTIVNILKMLVLNVLMVNILQLRK